MRAVKRRRCSATSAAIPFFTVAYRCRSCHLDCRCMGRFDHLAAQFDPVNKKRKGDQFELVCKWFLENDPVYEHELRRVWLWDDWPGRWGGDAGIDLVAEDRQGRLWAIQAKAYAETTTITKSDVDTFLAEAGRPEFSFRLLIATTNLIGRTAKRTIEAQEKQTSVVLRGDLEAAAVNWPASPSALRARPPKPKRPRPHQREAIKSVVKGFERSDRGQMIMACGTGKTLAALFIHEKLAAKRTLVLVPSLSLLKQTLSEWTANTKTGFDFLPVCSDKTVAEPDAVVSHTSDLGFPVTTDPAQIATFLRRRSGPRVVFSTYQSSPQIAEAFELGRVPTFDLVVADEAHRCAGPISSDFGTILDATKIKAHRRLFMTATPRYFTGRVQKEAKENDFEVASMNDEKKFGPVFHRLGFSEAIERDMLTDYQVVVVGVDDTTYLDWAQRGQFITRDGAKGNARTLAGQIGLAKAMRRYDLHRIITFHSRIKKAREFARSLPEVIAWMPARHRPKGQLWSDHATGDMPAGQRHILLQRLRKLDDGERGLLANARCLAEGVDVPALDGVAFIDPRRSKVDIVQAVGRAIRLADNKEVGTIVIPVFIDTNEDPEIALDDSAFNSVWDVVKALRAHDDDLGEMLDTIRRQLGGPGGPPGPPGKIHFDLPARVGVDFARAFNVRLVEQTTNSWEFWFGLLEKYVEDNDHALVPASYKVDGHNLGWWVHNQRAFHSRGTLEADRERRLQDVPGWTWDTHADAWEEGFNRLLQYVDHHRNALVPAFYKIDGYRLGQWVGVQRGNHAKGSLEADRESRLQDVPGWTWDPFADAWEEGFNRLLQYVEGHDHALVPDSYKVDGYNLGGWVRKQRSSYVKGALEADRQRRLQDVPGWVWSSFAAKWEEGFQRLRDYVEGHDHALVPASYKVDGYNLGSWVSRQRVEYVEGTLEADRQQRLEDLPGWTWDPIRDDWEKKFSLLLDYVESHDHPLVPHSYKVDGNYLGRWVANQRAVYSRGTLEADRQQRLEDLPGWTWDPIGDAWEKKFSRLLDYVERHGDARVPASYEVDGHLLGKWVSHQRASYSRGTLEADRQQRLQELPGWVWKAR